MRLQSPYSEAVMPRHHVPLRRARARHARSGRASPAPNYNKATLSSTPHKVSIQLSNAVLLWNIRLRSLNSPPLLQLLLKPIPHVSALPVFYSSLETILSYHRDLSAIQINACSVLPSLIISSRSSPIKSSRNILGWTWRFRSTLRGLTGKINTRAGMINVVYERGKWGYTN